MAIEVMGIGLAHAGLGILGVGVGFVLSKVMSGKKEQVKKFMPDDLQNWMIPTAWGDILSNKKGIEFAKRELEILEQEERDDKRKEVKIEEDLKQHLDKAQQIQAEIESAPNNLTQRSKSDILFARVMNRLAQLSYQAQAINNDSLPYARKQRFLELVSRRKSHSEIETAMNGDNIDGFRENPYNKNLDIIDAQWEAFDAIPGLQNKIIDEMLASPKQN